MPPPNPLLFAKSVSMGWRDGWDSAGENGAGARLRSPLSGKVVAREGSVPPISGCRPDVMLFHHRALRTKWIIGLFGTWPPLVLDFRLPDLRSASDEGG